MSKSKFEKLQEKALKLDFILTKVIKGDDYSGRYIFTKVGNTIPTTNFNDLKEVEVFIKTKEGIYA